MSVNHEMRMPVGRASSRAGRVPPGFGDDDGMTGGGTNSRIQADFAAMPGEPIGAVAQVLFVLRLCRDAREAEVFAQFRDKARLMAFQIIEHDLHGIS